ncbi:MAG: manganese efflux pump [Candidatus Aenigmarchaeota archaeon]|nr:manganese efflux pump [Candidatus Aenigmarchaeota archaeon]
MNIEIILIAIGISMDIFAVSIALGFSGKKQTNQSKKLHVDNNGLKISIFFGLFHAIMISIGYYVGLGFRELIAGTGFWIASILLIVIGVKMIYESKKMKNTKNVLNDYSLILLSIATSIDAFIIGTTFSILNVSIIESVFIIGVVAFFMSFIGFVVGKKIGHLFETKIEIIGGIILILIALKILLENIIV